MTTISAIVPTFNRSNLVNECIDSLLAQTRRLDRIIVVNDGSTDDTQTVLTSYCHKITVIDQPNCGKAAALNVALQQCNTDYIWICDDDDVAHPQGAKNLSRVLDANEKIDFVYGDLLRFTDTVHGRKLMPHWHTPRPGEDSVLINFLEGMVSLQFAQLVRRSLYERVGAFREDLIRSQDYEMSIRLARYGRSAYVPRVIFYARQHDGRRGTLRVPIEPARKLQTVLEYEQLFFRELRSSLSLNELTPKFARSLKAPDVHRARLLQRATIFANRALWGDAIDDLEEACRPDPDIVPHSGEIDLASSVVRNRLAWDKLGGMSDELQRLRAIRNSGRYGRNIITALTRPLVWQIRDTLREGMVRPAFMRLRLMLSLLGCIGTGDRVLDSLLD